MKHFFIITDCSGSIVSDGSEYIGTINDLLRDLIEDLEVAGATDIRVICYANGAKYYWQSLDKKGFVDITENRFGGRSNLGKAYSLIKETIDAESIAIIDCALLLISDGEATDNFKKELQLLDAQNTAFRVAISIGRKHITTDKHASTESCLFNNGIAERDDFIEKSVEFINS